MASRFATLAIDAVDPCEVARSWLGARRVDVGQPPDVSWVVLADPEGNEFCLLATAVEDGEPGAPRRP